MKIVFMENGLLSYKRLNCLILKLNVTPSCLRSTTLRSVLAAIFSDTPAFFIYQENTAKLPSLQLPLFHIQQCMGQIKHAPIKLQYYCTYYHVK